ncbi:MAG: hypothetical protein LBS96_06995 [Oscillospiraceae bacterium]|jgi:hypothetical protein|nr:hypothetical protein [Oscillospiraceae bacterium]
MRRLLQSIFGMGILKLLVRCVCFGFGLYVIFALFRHWASEPIMEEIITGLEELPFQSDIKYAFQLLSQGMSWSKALTKSSFDEKLVDILKTIIVAFIIEYVRKIYGELTGIIRKKAKLGVAVGEFLLTVSISILLGLALLKVHDFLEGTIKQIGATMVDVIIVAGIGFLFWRFVLRGKKKITGVLEAGVSLASQLVTWICIALLQLFINNGTKDKLAILLAVWLLVWFACMRVLNLLKE